MGQLRTKTIKGQHYFYYSVRTRSRKKFGGSGKVKSIEYCLGSYFYPHQWRSETGWLTPAIAYYFWNGDISLTDFIEAHVRYRFSRCLDEFTWEIDTKRQKVKLRSNRSSDFDGRWQWVREAVKHIELAFGALPTMEEAIAETIEKPWREYLDCERKRKEYEAEAETHQRQRDYDEAAYYQDLANAYEGDATIWFELYQDRLNTFIKNCPRSIREEVKAKITNRLGQIK